MGINILRSTSLFPVEAANPIYFTRMSIPTRQIWLKCDHLLWYFLTGLYLFVLGPTKTFFLNCLSCKKKGKFIYYLSMPKNEDSP